MLKDTFGRTIIYDAFVRDGWLTLISTYYHYREGPALTIRVGGRTMQEFGRNEYEPVRYFRLRLADGEGAPSEVEINGVTHRLPIEVLPCRPRSAGFAVTTLFKHDWAHAGAMVDWYRAQGCTAFYLYFNGPVLPSGLPQGPDIHYRTWDFLYWNPGNYRDKETGWVHAAQMTYLTMARFRHLPDHEWLGFVDIDEHVWSNDGRNLTEVLATIPPAAMVVRTPCHWALRAPGRIIYTKVGERVGTRSKCFYRGDFNGMIGVHNPHSYTSIVDPPTLVMLHITNYGHSDRIKLIKEPRGVVPWPGEAQNLTDAGAGQPA